MPVPPNKHVEIDRKEGIPCVPVKVMRFRKGERVEIEALCPKCPLAEVRQSLLSAHEEFMRLHSDSEIESMSKNDVLEILQVGAVYTMWKS